MESLLLKIQNTVQQYADIMSRVCGIDVEVVDAALFRVAGTGLFADQVNRDMSGEGYVYRHAMLTGEVQFIDEPGRHPLCMHCACRDNCEEAIEVSKPILMEGECIGVIGLVGSSPAQREAMLAEREMYLSLLDQIAEFIAAKAGDWRETNRREAIIGTLDSVINHLSQGVLVIGQDDRITTANRAAHEQIGREALEGFRIRIEATGDRLGDGSEYRIRVQDRELVVHGTVYEIAKPSPRYARMLIFSGEEALHTRLYELTQLVNSVEMDGIVGSSESTRLLKREIAKVASSSSTILITGESGTGKEVAATAIWKLSERRNKKFVAINCGAIPEALLEAELFGYVKGAFTGADPGGRIGKFELADRGVLFLDEIGDMPLYLQVKLLRVLQERTIVRIGSNQVIPVDLRIIAATNRDLREMIATGMFREDLYYRLNVIPLRIAPLRERPEDIEDLARCFAARYAARFRKEFRGIAPAAMLALRAHPWPGNVRELENTVEFMVNMMGESGVLGPDTLPGDFARRRADAASGGAAQGGIHTLRELEAGEIRKALKLYGVSTAGKREAARSLGIGLATLYRKIDEYKINL